MQNNENKTIVITTINEPTNATLKFCSKSNWNVIIVGDLKTPHELYYGLEDSHENVKYMSPSEQEDKYKTLSDAIGWNCIQRRNIGFVEAYKNGSEIIASCDDDNFPYLSWGQQLYIHKETEVDTYALPENGDLQHVFEPLSTTIYGNNLYHRGYPIELISRRKEFEYIGRSVIIPDVQADLWDGDPDVDAMVRLTQKPIVKFPNSMKPFRGLAISPFNSQNTFLSRKVIPYYAVLPYVGRMDDIWGAYLLQTLRPQTQIIYNRATVFQDRNKQDLVRNLENEILGYRNTFKMLNDRKNIKNYLPKETLDFFETYQSMF